MSERQAAQRLGRLLGDPVADAPKGLEPVRSVTRCPVSCAAAGPKVLSPVSRTYGVETSMTPIAPSGRPARYRFSAGAGPSGAGPGGVRAVRCHHPVTVHGQCRLPLPHQAGPRETERPQQRAARGWIRRKRVEHAPSSGVAQFAHGPPLHTDWSVSFQSLTWIVKAEGAHPATATAHSVFGRTSRRARRSGPVAQAVGPRPERGRRRRV